jgi:hypothetical protein
MSVPTPPLDPNDPRAGDPTQIATWVKIGGVLILVIIVVTVTTWNRGPRHSSAVGPPAPSQSQTAAVSTGAAPDGTYKIIFDGTATGHTDRPNLGQTTKSSDATATWHLEYTYGAGHDGFPDLAASSVKASGTSTVWTNIAKGCTSSAATYTPKASVLTSGTAPDTFRLHPPFMGDLLSAPGAGCDPTKGDVDPYYLTWGGSCGTGDTCPDWEAFWTANFTIKAGQTGTVVTKFSPPAIEHSPPAAAGSINSKQSWSGTITVIAQ